MLVHLCVSLRTCSTCLYSVLPANIIHYSFLRGRTCTFGSKISIPSLISIKSYVINEKNDRFSKQMVKRHTVLSPTKHEVAPKWIIGAALGQHTANVCTCAITSCLLLFSSAAAKSKSMLERLAFISSNCSWVISRPSSCEVSGVVYYRATWNLQN